MWRDIIIEERTGYIDTKEEYKRVEEKNTKRKQRERVSERERESDREREVYGLSMYSE